ncbi:hypothetical protein C1I98_19805 [Spongiactinospora gelatinilytica]|uniref:Uncharacterized protein n=1 Tax=Spongiactinospora gelatinilytica TaxID=2666298 RepID=A0A2W2FY09_9ACTN|nr:hypothetical protein [Spongiactinospora gelatinilytica]PZG42436.1 hypothetical protein C1I98_19805 [Spongiactinospora gelatinilytica]
MSTNLRVGDVVEVRSADEILATLDENGELENLPFMPEMLRFCGQRMTVHKVAHKLCDTISRSGIRRMERAVHLTGARCDGAAHGGCQTACSLYWKEAWLKPASGPPPTEEPPRSLPLLTISTRREDGEDGEARYRCQATELLRAAPTCLPFGSLRQYADDVRSGNVGVAGSVRTFLVGLFNRFQDRAKRYLPRWLWIKDGLRWGFVKGGVTEGKTPTATLGLQPGEVVRIKSKAEIMATLNADLLNRGMGFEEEMARYCGRTARVRARVERCIDEKTGRLLTMKNPCIILEDIVCAGVYNANCPREFVPFWREIWLERVPAAVGPVKEPVSG